MKDTGISLPYFNCPLPMMGSKGQFNQRMVMMTLTTCLQAEGSCHGSQYSYHDFKNLTPNAFLFVFHFFDL